MAVLIYLCIILASVTQSISAKKYNAGNATANAFCFNALKGLAALTLFAFASLFGVTFHVPTMLYGACYGLSLCLSMYAGYRALCLGPMALTSMLVSFSVIIPLVWSVLFGQEKIGALQGIALGCLLISLLLVNVDKLKTGIDQKTNHLLWGAFVALTFLTNGVCSILQKAHQMAFPGSFNKEFVLSSMLVCAPVYILAALVTTPKGTFRKLHYKGFALLSGIANALASFFTLALAGFENASVLFPVISAGTILGSLFCGRLFFKERLKANQYVAVVFGTAAVVLLKL